MTTRPLAERRITLANALTAFRPVVAAPLMLACAAEGWREAFPWILAASFASDAVDGTVARLSGQVTRFGAMLDSWADVVAYCAIAIGVAVLWPGLVRAEAVAVAIIVASFLVPSAVGLLRFGHFTSYHTLLVKAAVATMAPALLLALWTGISWPLRIAAALAVLAALEEIAITCILDRPRSNVRGLRAVLRERRAARRS
ncbi:MAG: CDP-alcohol phosphatidyltransferase family protein [Gammaproteobacteria bacterium]